MLKRTFLCVSILTSGLLQSEPASAATYSCAEYLTVPALSSNTSSMVAASAMAAHCFGRGFVAPPVAAWEADQKTAFTSDCVMNSRGSGVAWPGSCNPAGALSLLNNRTRGYGHHWVSLIRDNTETNMGRVLLDKMRIYRTPIVLPYVGNWDHWVTVTRVDTMGDPAAGTEQFVTVRLHDGLPMGVIDSGGKTSIGSPATIQSARNFVRDYMGIMSFIGAPCHDEITFRFECSLAPYFDPWYYKYLFLYEPPAGTTLLGERSAGPSPSVAQPPGLVRRGRAMSAALATQHYMESLRNGGALEYSDVKQMLAEGNVTQAVLVHGIDGQEQAWDYYLLPVAAPAGGTSGFVLLSAGDGSFESAYVLDRALPSLDFNEQAARVRAQRMLVKDEQLGTGTLAWRPVIRGGLNDSPALPYYEFEVLKESGEHAGLLRIALHDPKVSQRIK